MDFYVFDVDQSGERGLPILPLKYVRPFMEYYSLDVVTRPFIEDKVDLSNIYGAAITSFQMTTTDSYLGGECVGFFVDNFTVSCWGSCRASVVGVGVFGPDKHIATVSKGPFGRSFTHNMAMMPITKFESIHLKVKAMSAVTMSFRVLIQFMNRDTCRSEGCAWHLPSPSRASDPSPLDWCDLADTDEESNGDLPELLDSEHDDDEDFEDGEDFVIHPNDPDQVPMARLQAIMIWGDLPEDFDDDRDVVVERENWDAIV